MWAGMGHWCRLAQGRIQLQSQQRQLVFSFLVSSVGTDTIQLCSSLRNKLKLQGDFRRSLSLAVVGREAEMVSSHPCLWPGAVSSIPGRKEKADAQSRKKPLCSQSSQLVRSDCKGHPQNHLLPCCYPGQGPGQLGIAQLRAGGCRQHRGEDRICCESPEPTLSHQQA